MGAAAAIVNAFREAAYSEKDMVNVARRLDASSTRYNAAFPPEGPMERFATALLVEIPHEGRRIGILNCGHPPPLLLNGGKVRFLEPTNPSALLSLAELIGDHYNVDTFDFAPDDLLLLYTDGIAETRARDGEFFPLAAWMRRQPPTPPQSCSRPFTATFSTTAEEVSTTTSPPSPYGCAGPEPCPGLPFGSVFGVRRSRCVPGGGGDPGGP